jgi:hypothetical protein
MFRCVAKFVSTGNCCQVHCTPAYCRSLQRRNVHNKRQYSSYCYGRAVYQAVSRRPLTAEDRARDQVNVGFVDKLALGQIFLRELRFPLSVAPYSYIIWLMTNAAAVQRQSLPIDMDSNTLGE